jgi:hypothetical protein
MRATFSAAITFLVFTNLGNPDEYRGVRGITPKRSLEKYDGAEICTEFISLRTEASGRLL